MTFTFAPAASFTERAGVFVSLTGGTNSGKTYSALRLAKGIAGPGGKVAVLDTEGGRTLHLKRDFDFHASIMEPPFRPERFAEAAEAAERAGYGALVIDSFTMEWAGVGGVLDWQAEEHRRLGGQDSKKGQSWIKPKMAHKGMVFSLLQRRIPIVFSIRGEESFVPPNTKLFKSVTSKTFPFEVTVSFRLEADRKGYIDLSDARSWKMEGAHQEIFRHGEQLSEAHGAALAAWARGETPAPCVPAGAGERPQSGRERLMAAARRAAAEGTAALLTFRETLDERQDSALRQILAEIELVASEADASFGTPRDISPPGLAA